MLTWPQRFTGTAGPRAIDFGSSFKELCSYGCSLTLIPGGLTSYMYIGDACTPARMTSGNCTVTVQLLLRGGGVEWLLLGLGVVHLMA